MILEGAYCNRRHTAATSRQVAGKLTSCIIAHAELPASFRITIRYRMRKKAVLITRRS